MNRDIDAKIENIFSQMEDETLDESLGDWRLCGTENAKKSITSLIEAEVEKAVIQDRLNTWQRLTSIHEKYPNDDKDSDREFRNDFMSEFSKFMDETTELIKNLQEN